MSRSHHRPIHHVSKPLSYGPRSLNDAEQYSLLNETGFHFSWSQHHYAHCLICGHVIGYGETVAFPTDQSLNAGPLCWTCVGNILSYRHGRTLDVHELPSPYLAGNVPAPVRQLPAESPRGWPKGQPPR